MGHKLNKVIYASELAARFELILVGEDLPVSNISGLSEAGEGALSFMGSSAATLPLSSCVLIAASGVVGFSVLISDNPRLMFAKILNFLDEEIGFLMSQESPMVDPSARIGLHTVLGRGVRIGANSVVHNFVVIGDGVQVGENCIIKSGAIIGEDGFGFERDELGLPLRLLHLGSVRIGNNVEIGSLTTVCRGTLADTIILDHAKIDDHVHIAHNCKIGMGAMVVACAEVSGGVVLGDRSWVGPNASIIQKRTIGDDALIGIGANVVRDVAAGTTVAGNPAKPLIAKNV